MLTVYYYVQEKKTILKQIKTTGATCDLATSEYGYLILLALFDSVDDTVVVKKVHYKKYKNL